VSAFWYPASILSPTARAAEMLDALRVRVHNSREVELAEAAGQQRLITQIRLRKLLGL